MNRKQHRAAGKTARANGHKHAGNLCPACNANVVIAQLCHNTVRCANGDPVMYYTGKGPATATTPAIFDFGILAVHLEPATAAVTVTSYDRTVFRMTPDRVEFDEPGAWVKTLAAVRAHLDAQFGRADRIDQDESADEGERLECQGSDYEDIAREHIAASGQFIMAVFGDPGELWCSYTIGNHEKNLPELLIVYPGRKDLYHACGAALNRAGEIQRERGKPFEHGELVTLTEGKPPALVVEASVRAKADYTFGVGHYYGTDGYEVRQLLYPDKAGRFPGDPLCAEPYASLPVLSPPAN